MLKKGPFAASEKERINEAIKNYLFVRSVTFPFTKLSDHFVERAAHPRSFNGPDF